MQNFFRPFSTKQALKRDRLRKHENSWQASDFRWYSGITPGPPCIFQLLSVHDAPTEAKATTIPSPTPQAAHRPPSAPDAPRSRSRYPHRPQLRLRRLSLRRPHRPRSPSTFVDWGSIQDWIRSLFCLVIGSLDCFSGLIVLPCSVEYFLCCEPWNPSISSCDRCSLYPVCCGFACCVVSC
jgi:hypothetical protein